MPGSKMVASNSREASTVPVNLSLMVKCDALPVSGFVASKFKTKFCARKDCLALTGAPLYVADNAAEPAPVANTNKSSPNEVALLLMYTPVLMPSLSNSAGEPAPSTKVNSTALPSPSARGLVIDKVPV